MLTFDIKNYLQSGFSFTDQEGELKLKYQFFNILLALNLFVVTSAAVIRFIRGEDLQAYIDITYSLVGLGIIFFARIDKKYFNTLIKFVLIFSLILVSFTYYIHTNGYVGLSWFFVQIIIVLFLADRKFAYAMLLISVVVILLTHYIKMDSENFKSAIFGLFPLIVFSIFMSAYERRNRLQKKMLREQNDLLEKYTFEIENYDALTHLPNRNLFMRKVNQKIFSKKVEHFFILKIDIDNFKNINDSYGYRLADKIVFEFSKRLESLLPNRELLSKSGPDEFLVMIHADNLDTINQLTHEIMDCVKEPFIMNEKKFFITVSIGIAQFPDDAKSSALLIQNVDSALHIAKESGKHCIKFYDATLTNQLNEEMSLLQKLQEATSNDELEVYFQPQINASTNKLIGMEALVRWRHPELGLMSPIKFIPLAEKHNILKNIDFFVMKSAMQSFVQWKKSYPDIGRLSLNLSMQLLEDEEYIIYLKRILTELEFQTEWLELEIVESQIMHNPQQSIELLQEIKDLGIKISIDDFGTGYSSLSYLQKLPVSKLKIDRSFVLETPHNESSNNLVKLIINLSKSLNLTVIAEGIETEEQKEFLLQSGCSSIQGYFYAKPLTKEAMLEFIQKN